MNVHDHITDWQHLPSSFLAGKRAIATTVEGTTIDGFLQSMTTKFSNGIDSDYQAKDEEDAWDFAGVILGMRECYAAQARDLLEIARKAVNE